MKTRLLARAGLFVTILLAAAPVVAAPVSPQPGSRQRINFNRDWKFEIGDHPGAEAPAFAETGWQRVGLPHSFSLPYFRSAEFYVGYGWYRKHFRVPPAWRGKRVFLEFEAAFQDAEVFINGRKVGRHQGGYTGFSFDISQAVKPGENVVAVRVNNLWNPQLAPRAGEHIFIGGIYRDVYLVVTDPVHVTWYGTFATTPQVSAESARVNMKTEVKNDAAAAQNVAVVNTVVDPDGQAVATMRASHSLAAGETFTFDQTSDSIAHPKLWHPDHPFLYRVRTQVLVSGRTVDGVETPLGFRWFTWTADKGFFLNGEHYYLRGANAHQDHAGWGIAVTQTGAYRDVKMIKEAGFNFIRGSHYPHHPAFAEACDRLGLIFWSEGTFWGKGGFGKDGYWNASAYPVKPQDFAPFEESCRETMREMIRINRNHPSIVVWSISNEPFFTENVERAQALAVDLVKLSHSLDPTRLAAVGGAQRKDFDKLGDVAGYNGDGARLFINPGFPSMVTEYGAIGKGMPGEYAPYFGDLEGQPEYPWRGGQAIWCGFDYGTIAGKQGFKGIIDYFRLPKRSWYWYRNEYRKIPPPQWPRPGTPAKLALSADKTTIQGTDATDDAQITVSVLDSAGRRISNSPPVTLTVAEGPAEFPTGRSITFEPNSAIMIVDGQAAMELRSYYGGKSVIRATSPGLEPATLTIDTVGTPVYIPGKTPPVADRPYVPGNLSAFRSRLEVTANVGRDRPARAGGEMDGHPARFANDGDESTWWSAPGTGNASWWQLDLEGFYLLSAAKIDFAAAGTYQHKVEVSTDGTVWKTVAESSAAGKSVTDEFPAGTVARYVRIRFEASAGSEAPRVAEVAVSGSLSTQ